MSNATGGASLGATTASISVVDPTTAGQIAFTAANQGATAGQSNPVTISVARPGAGISAPVASVVYTCTVATSSGAYTPAFTAPAGATNVANSAGVASGTINWTNGTIGGNATQAITATLPAFAPGTTGANISCTLTNPTGAAAGSILQHVVTIAQPAAAPTCNVVDATAWLPANVSTPDRYLNPPQGVVVSYKFTAAQLITGAPSKYGFVMVYETRNAPQYEISNVPCDISMPLPTPGIVSSFAVCARQGSTSDSYPLMKYMDPTNPDIASRTSIGWCTLGPPDANNFYYVNIKMPNTCGGTCPYYLFYQQQ